MYRYIGDILTQIRRDTNNLSEAIVVSSSEGIQDVDFVRGFNRAQNRIQSRIVDVNLTAFEKQKFVDVVSNQVSYDLPDDIYLGNKLNCVEFSPTGQLEDYYQLTKKNAKERNNLSTSYLEGYIPINKTIQLDPSPQSAVTNGLRLTYVQKLPSIDLRRTKVTAVTLNGSSRTITSLAVDVLNDPALTGDNLTAFQENNYFSIVDKYGSIKMNRIPWTSVDTNTGVITVPGTFVYEVGQSITVGDYLVTGYNATSHSQLDDDLERYLELFCTRYIFNRDSSDDAVAADAELKEIEQDIVDKFTTLNEDVEYPVILDDSFIAP